VRMVGNGEDAVVRMVGNGKTELRHLQAISASLLQRSLAVHSATDRSVSVSK